MKNILWLLAMLMYVEAHAQIQVGSNEVATRNKPGKLTEDDIAQLKTTTTLFLLQNKDYDKLSEWENAIRSVWTITPFKIITRDELNKYKSAGYSFFSFGGFVVQRRSATTSTSSVHLTYDLWMPHRKKNGDVKGEDYYARIIVYPDNATMFNAGSAFGTKDLNNRMNNSLYTRTEIYNWSPTMLKGYLKTVNDRLIARDTRGPFDEEENETALQALKKDTLYIPDYVNLKFNAFTGQETEADMDDDMHDAYPYPVKIVSMAELEKKISNASGPVYYLAFVKSSSDKFVDVFEAKSGNLLFARYTPLSFNFKNRDLKNLYKTIR